MGTLARNRLRVTLTTQDLNTTSRSRSNIATTSKCHNIAMTLQWQSYEICSLEINFSFLIIASVAVFAATWANFQPKAWEKKKTPWKKFLMFSKKIMPLKTSYTLEWNMILPIAQTLCALWKNCLCFLKKPSRYLGQFPAKPEKISYISPKKVFRHISGWLLIKL